MIFGICKQDIRSEDVCIVWDHPQQVERITEMQWNPPIRFPLYQYQAMITITMDSYVAFVQNFPYTSM